MANPQVELHIAGRGVITLELDEAKAPKSVANFLSYVKSGHYDNTVFHRVIPGFMVQGGGFKPGMDQKSTQAPITNALCRTVNRANAPRRSLYSPEVLAAEMVRSRTRVAAASGGSASWPSTLKGAPQGARTPGRPRACRGGRRGPGHRVDKPCNRGACRTTPTPRSTRRRPR